VIAGFFGCASSQLEAPWPEPRPLGDDLPVYRAPADPDAVTTTSASLEEPTGLLTLRQALALALLHNPELAGTSWEVRKKEAETLQAGLLPNPELELEVEEFGGSGERSGVDAAEATLQISQLIELGGKRAKRERVAALERDLAGWDYEAKRLDVLTKATRQFIDVLGGQERLALADENVRISEEELRTVAERVGAGNVSPIEETKARVTLAISRVDQRLARRDLALARSRLAATWGSDAPSFQRAEGELPTVSAVPSLEAIADRISRNPDVARWVAEIGRRRAVVALEDAGRIPDLTLGAGPQWFNETDDAAMAMSLSIPIPLMDRNQGARRAARFDLRKALEERRAVEIEVRKSLAEAHEALAAAYGELELLRRDALPGAQAALDAVGEGYRLGKLDYLDVLDSQRTFFNTRQLEIEALVAYHKAVADLERLTGMPLDAAGNASNSMQEGNL
jgi:cobalt-zinc-cadmium efflux system outer membrane protein